MLTSLSSRFDLPRFSESSAAHQGLIADSGRTPSFRLSRCARREFGANRSWACAIGVPHRPATRPEAGFSGPCADAKVAELVDAQAGARGLPRTRLPNLWLHRFRDGPLSDS